MKYICGIIILTFLFFAKATAQQKINVLFIGNSYTYVNNLPEMTKQLLVGSKKSMQYDSNTPGGCTLEQHLNLPNSLSLIRQGNWDYVVLQEQSQLPSIDYYRYQSMYPVVERLTDSIKKYSPCATVVMYVTWGRRFGGQQCVDFGSGLYCSADFRDFDHMQDTLTSSYSEIAYQTNAYIAPAGEAWREVIRNTDIVLHSSDNSHPGLAGTYLTACVLHSVFWHESPIGLYNGTSLDDETADILQQYAHQVVMETPTRWNLHIDDVHSAFTDTVEAPSVTFFNHSECINPIEYLWSFGDGEFSTEENPIHTYQQDGEYLVKLKAISCLKSSSCEQIIQVYTDSTIDHEQRAEPILYPNRVSNEFFIISDEDYSVEIINALGTSVFKENDLSGKQSIKIDFLPNSLYLVKIQYSKDNRTFVKKLLKI